MMQKIIEELKKRGFVDSLQRSVDVCSKLDGADEERQLYASKKCLEKYILDLDNDDELCDDFIEFATDLAAEAIIKELNLKPQDCEVSEAEETIVNLLKLLKTIKEDK